MAEKKIKIEEDDILLRIFISEKDKVGSMNLYEVIVDKAKKLGLAGATVIRGLLGFGADKHLHSAKLVDLSNDLPIIIEIVDCEEKIKELLPFFDEYVTEGFITLRESTCG